MTDLEPIVDTIRRTDGCRVLPPRGVPVLVSPHRLPDDLHSFYRLCGGVRLFDDGEYPIRIVEPERFVKANPEIVGVECHDDISDGWYIVARGGAEEAISIDCHPDRHGRCYDSFWDSHAVAGECAIVALSFTELLRRLLSARGGYWYWLVEGGAGHGDAYGR
jgi:hypothetical protein